MTAESTPVERAAEEVIRFWSKVSIEPGQCWEWREGRFAPWGYGRFYLSPVAPGVRAKQVRAHRYAYELLVGPIPEGMFLLHRCDNPPCVNPAHLRVGTHEDNMADMRARGRSLKGRWKVTHCAKGHEFTPENTYLPPDGHRACRECARARRRRQKAAAKARQVQTDD